jgi:hypothetical protein
MDESSESPYGIFGDCACFRIFASDMFCRHATPPSLAEALQRLTSMSVSYCACAAIMGLDSQATNAPLCIAARENNPREPFVTRWFVTQPAPWQAGRQAAAQRSVAAVSMTCCHRVGQQQQDMESPPIRAEHAAPHSHCSRRR